MSADSLATPAIATTTPSLRGAVIAIALGLLALGLLFHTEVAAAIAVWIESTAYNHCFLVIPIVAYLLWERRDTLIGASARPYPLAALVALPLVLAWLLAERLGIMEGRQLVAVSFAEVLFFAVLGPHLWWRLSGPLLYLYFLVPFGAFLTGPLQDVTAVFVRHGLALTGIPAFIDGYVIEIPEGTFLIAEACAGLRFLIAAVAFGCLYALLMYRSPVRRAVFIAASIIVPIIANGFRALGIVALGHILGSAQAAATDHVLYGWIFFSIVILLLIAIGLPFREDQQPYPPDRTTPPRGTGFRATLPATVALVVLAAIGPAIAAGLNRAAASVGTVEIPGLVADRVCTMSRMPLTSGLEAPGRMRVQRFACGDFIITLNIEVFSPRTTALPLIAEQRRIVGEEDAEEAETRLLPVPDGEPRTWRLTVMSNPDRGVATSLWVDGKPTLGGLRMRMRQAVNSVLGSPFPPVVVAVTVEPGMPLGGGRFHPDSVIVGFLEAHPELSGVIQRLAGGGR